MKTYVPRDPVPSEVKKELSEYPELLQDILYSRGIASSKEAEEFLNPSWESHIHDPYLFKDMEKAVGRILRAIENRELIVIWSDYDCDGIPGGVILRDFFAKIGYDRFLNYIPHRHNEGYGLNIEGIESLASQGAALLITVDSGIADVPQVARANELGIDVIITDHHLPQAAGLPEAYAIINPKREGETYAFDGLCGAGVAFKLVQAILRKNRFDVSEGWEKWLLDMAGLSTIADMMPLVGENRALAHFGLRVLRKSPRKGVRTLLKALRISQRDLTEDDLGFMIAPRINAASRMGEPMDAFRLLSTDDQSEAEELTIRLNGLNDERKGVVASIAKEIKKRMKTIGAPKELIVMGDPRWRPSLLGLAANTLMEEYRRPVFLWGREALSAGRQGEAYLKGSCRSDGSVSVVELMSSRSEVFLDFGGHKFSGGFSVSHERIHTLESELISAYMTLRVDMSTAETTLVDRILSIDEVTWDTYRAIEGLAPFGEGNPKPLFLFPSLRIEGVKRFGREGAHLELQFENFEGKKISAIAFFAKPDQFSKRLEVGERIDLVAHMEKSTFRRFPELRLRIVDII